jgi:hypothetical protein
MYDYYSELHNKLLKTRNSVRARPDQLNDLIPLVDDVPFEQKEHFEIELEQFLLRLQGHYEVWSKVLAESKKRKQSIIRRVK